MNACTRVCLRTCTCFYGPDVESLDATRERHSVTFTTVTTRLFTSSAEVPWQRDASCLFQLIPQRTGPSDSPTPFHPLQVSDTHIRLPRGSHGSFMFLIIFPTIFFSLCSLGGFYLLFFRLLVLSSVCPICCSTSPLLSQLPLFPPQF